MGLEEQLLTASISDTIHKARKAVSKLRSLSEQSTQDNVDEADALGEGAATLPADCQMVTR
jgi:hypothetical protein